MEATTKKQGGGGERGKGRERKREGDDALLYSSGSQPQEGYHSQEAGFTISVIQIKINSPMTCPEAHHPGDCVSYQVDN